MPLLRLSVVLPYKEFDDPSIPPSWTKCSSGWAPRWWTTGQEPLLRRSHDQISEPEAFELIRRLRTAPRNTDDVIACLCPMCQLNLDAYQGRLTVSSIRISYSHPVLHPAPGLAFGCVGRTWFWQRDRDRRSGPGR